MESHTESQYKNMLENSQEDNFKVSLQTFYSKRWKIKLILRLLKYQDIYRFVHENEITSINMVLVLLNGFYFQMIAQFQFSQTFSYIDQIHVVCSPKSEPKVQQHVNPNFNGPLLCKNIQPITNASRTLYHYSIMSILFLWFYFDIVLIM